MSYIPGVEVEPQNLSEKPRTGPYLLDQTEVTVAQFEEFVRATGYRTQAEITGASAVFRELPQDLTVSDREMWIYVGGATWRYPYGPKEPAAKPNEPVTQVSLADAKAFARWLGRDLPTEQEWEWAAKGGDRSPSSSVQWAYSDQGVPIANTWQGFFPYHETGEDGFPRVAPVGCFQPNGYGLYDMIGNVWEITTNDANTPILKGGSFLCSFNWCANFTPSARIVGEGFGISSSHVGFRTIIRRP